MRFLWSISLSILSKGFRNNTLASNTFLAPEIFLSPLFLSSILSYPMIPLWTLIPQKKMHLFLVHLTLHDNPSCYSFETWSSFQLYFVIQHLYILDFLNRLGVLQNRRLSWGMPRSSDSGSSTSEWEIENKEESGHEDQVDKLFGAYLEKLKVGETIVISSLSKDEGGLNCFERSLAM